MSEEIINKLSKMINFDKNLIGWQIGCNGETISKEEIKQLVTHIKDLQHQLEQKNTIIKEARGLITSNNVSVTSLIAGDGIINIKPNLLQILGDDK